MAISISSLLGFSFYITLPLLAFPFSLRSSTHSIPLVITLKSSSYLSFDTCSKCSLNTLTVILILCGVFFPYVPFFLKYLYMRPILPFSHASVHCLVLSFHGTHHLFSIRFINLFTSFVASRTHVLTLVKRISRVDIRSSLPFLAFTLTLIFNLLLACDLPVYLN